MANNQHIQAGELGVALERTLTIYEQDLQKALATVTEESTLELVRMTKATAPVGRRKGQYKKAITANFRDLREAKSLQRRDVKGIWYVKAPDYRLTHLLVHGHATSDGGRTRANPFLQNACDKVLPEYERKVQEMIENGG